ncbi:MAG: hypothetical protein Q8909_08250 [Bacteroidota bacterium]|nr:hypothetical protein [Bacteroidota bacterium]
MEKAQQDKLGMFLNVQGVCLKFKSVWSSNAIFSAAYKDFDESLASLLKLRNVQLGSNASPATDKQEKYEVMIAQTMFAINRLWSYASTVGDTVLLAKLNYTESDLRKLRETAVGGVCSNVADLAEENLPQITEYGFSAELLAQLRQANADFNDVISAPKLAIVEQKNATEGMVPLFAKEDGILANRLDKDIELLKNSNPDFYNQYFAARKIISSGSTTMAIKGKTTDKHDGSDIIGVTLTITDAGSAEAALVKKNKTAGFSILNFKEGHFIATASKIGYKDALVPFTVVKGEMTTLVIEMEKA